MTAQTLINHMISFIIIGKNEEKNIARCIDSVYNAWNYCKSRNRFFDFEIVYVDSDSTDKTVEIANSYKEVRSFKIIGPSNAANGRNIGALEAKGKWLFFLDGDMQLNAEFLYKYWDESNPAQEPFMFGEWIDVIDGVEGLRPMSPIYPGGCFLILKSLWDKYQMDNRLTTGEEADMALRMLVDKHEFERKAFPMIKHFTVSYVHPSRIWKRIFNKSIFYSKSVTYRKHIFNKYMYPLLWRNDKTILLLIFSVITLIFSPAIGLAGFVAYLVLTFYRSIKNKKYISVFSMMLQYIVIDIFSIVYFLILHPKRIEENYIQIK